MWPCSRMEWAKSSAFGAGFLKIISVGVTTYAVMKTGFKGRSRP